MALRAFRANPSLGGFGNENSLGSSEDTNADAFAQIVKELCDNAVDACTARSCSTIGTQLVDDCRRVRVLFESVANQSVLKVTVSDNGCGMEDIETCVAVFSSTKRGNRRGPVNSNIETSQVSREAISQDPIEPSVSSKTETLNDLARGEDENKEEIQTTGRYGIGLSLCLLHAQSMIENSYALISSTTSSCSVWNKVKYVVDEEKDIIRCIEKSTMEKSAVQSGTSVSMLIPGGDIATKSWPRLAEYFARFQLNKKLECSIEVKAPMLSHLPLFIRSSVENSRTTNTIKPLGDVSINASNMLEDDKWQDEIDERQIDHRETKTDSISNISDRIENNPENEEDCYKGIHKAIQRGSHAYLRCQSIELKNIAHSTHPIRNIVDSKTDFHHNSNTPRLEVDMIIYQGSRDDESTNIESSSPWKGSMSLVRMVNGVPLLDSVEAKACGLVLGLASMTNTWKAFGLEVSLSSDDVCKEAYLDQPNGDNSDEIGSINTNSILNIPTFDVKDSMDLYKYFRSYTHDKFVFESDNESESSNDENQKDKKLPAGIRIGNILVVAQIHATPSELPLPTLSKSRLPVRDQSINRAFELGIISCLKSIQKSNQDLLFTISQMKYAERTLKYIPAASAAIASIITRSKSSDFQSYNINTINAWSKYHAEINPNNIDNEPISGNAAFDIKSMGSLIEDRFQNLFKEKPSTSGKKRKHKTKTTKNDLSQIGDDNISYSSSICDEVIYSSELVREVDVTSRVKRIEISSSQDEASIDNDTSHQNPDSISEFDIPLNTSTSVTFDDNDHDDDEDWW